MDFNRAINSMDKLHKPFKSREEFLEKDVKINAMMLDFTLYAVAGLAVGVLLFKGKTPIGFMGGAAGTWKLRDHIERQ